jgi:hypothetical protein
MKIGMYQYCPGPITDVNSPLVYFKPFYGFYINFINHHSQVILIHQSVIGATDSQHVALFLFYIFFHPIRLTPIGS